jgi:exodeoxyribonuclease VII small subunit
MGRKTGRSFEEALMQLEGTVEALSSSDLPLEEALKLFEQGVRLSKDCLKTLEEAEKKVEMLTQDKSDKQDKPDAPDAEEERLSEVPTEMPLDQSGGQSDGQNDE